MESERNQQKVIKKNKDFSLQEAFLCTSSLTLLFSFKRAFQKD